MRSLKLGLLGRGSAEHQKGNGRQNVIGVEHPIVENVVIAVVSTPIAATLHNSLFIYHGGQTQVLILVNCYLMHNQKQKHCIMHSISF